MYQKIYLINFTSSILSTVCNILASFHIQKQIEASIAVNEYDKKIAISAYWNSQNVMHILRRKLSKNQAYDIYFDLER